MHGNIMHNKHRTVPLNSHAKATKACVHVLHSHALMSQNIISSSTAVVMMNTA